MNMKAELLYKCGNITGEAATWIEGRNALLWVDIEGRKLFEYMPDNIVKEHLFDDMVTTIIPDRNDNNKVILSLQNKLVSYNLNSHRLKKLVDIPTKNNALRTNDGKASPDGKIWLGVMHFSDHKETGYLYSIDRDYKVQKMLDKQYIPNGIVWNKEGDKMYYADSGRGCITQYDYDKDKGRISLPRKTIEIPDVYGIPDGMAIDEEGMLWAAHWGGHGVYVWNPESGNLIDKIEVPAPNAASCTFGGKDNKTLFITTAQAGLSNSELKQYPLSGSLFAVETHVKGGINHYPF